MIWREPYVILGAAAMVTKHITLATGVTNPITRDLGVLAAAWVTLRETVGDRLADRDWFRRQLGGDARQEAVNAGQLGAVGRRAARSDQRQDNYLGRNQGRGPVDLCAVSRTPIPVYPAVSSPKIHRLAGKIGDGAIVLVGVDPHFLQASRRELEAGAGEAGTTLKDKKFRVVCWTPCSILDDGRAARRAVKAHVSRILKRKLPFELDAAAMEVVNKIRQAI